MSFQPAPGRTADTIFAIASGVGRAAITVMRVSGANAAQTLRSLAGSLPTPRRASLRHLRMRSGALLDRSLVLWLPGPDSYTGEDVCELHLHGGRAVADAAIRELLELGCRPADAGEFTRRAFHAGRMDLFEAEAIGDLVDSETESQRIQALAMLQGGAREVVQDWSDRLIRCLAHQEAMIDFPDETSDEGAAAIIDDALAIVLEMDQHLARATSGERVRNGVRVAIIGAPNVGKSSLLNALAGRDASIVSVTPGTTRDVIEVHLDLRGVAVTLADTAGLRDTKDAVEAEGMRRAHLTAQAADFVLHVIDAGDSTIRPYAANNCLVVQNKIDLFPAQDGLLGVSAHTGEGLDGLRSALADEVHRLTQADGGPILSRARQVAALRDTREALLNASNQLLPELRGEDLRLALQCVGRLSGRVGVEDVLDVVFGSFCIGK